MIIESTPSKFFRVVEHSAEWRKRLEALKADNQPEDATWYGYDILANICHVDKLLGSDHDDLLERVKGARVADIGAADGDLGFFLESLGFDVDLIDWPATNWNGLKGAYKLKELLNSGAGIHEVDIDSNLVLPNQEYGLVLLLGILYHLKNPFSVLERLAKSSKYCLLSTRVAQWSPDSAIHLAQAPLAYLLAPDECNNDATNYWIFSMPGLLRLVDRCGWTVLAQLNLGDTAASNPSSPEHDERAFLLLKSCV